MKIIKPLISLLKEALPLLTLALILAIYHFMQKHVLVKGKLLQLRVIKNFKFLKENIRINNFEIYAYLNLIGNMERVSIQNRKADDMIKL